jgi:hypothetical protein
VHQGIGRLHLQTVDRRDVVGNDGFSAVLLSGRSKLHQALFERSCAHTDTDVVRATSGRARAFIEKRRQKLQATELHERSVSAGELNLQSGARGPLVSRHAVRLVVGDWIVNGPPLGGLY